MQEYELMEYRSALGINGNGEHTNGTGQVFREDGGRKMMDILEVKARMNELRLRNSIEYSEVQELISALSNFLNVLGEEVVLAAIRQFNNVLEDKVIVFTVKDLESEENQELEVIKTARELYKQLMLNPVARIVYKDKRVWTEEELREAIQEVRSLSGGLTREDVERILQEVLQDKIEEIKNLFEVNIDEIRQRIEGLEGRVASLESRQEGYVSYDLSPELEGIRQEIMLLQNRLTNLEEQGMGGRELFMQLQDLQNKVEVLFSSLSSAGQINRDEIEEMVRREILGHIASLEEKIQSISTQQKSESPMEIQSWEVPASESESEEEEEEKVGNLYQEGTKETKKKKGFIESLLEDPKIKYGLIGLLGFIALWLILRLL